MNLHVVELHNTSEIFLSLSKLTPEQEVLEWFPFLQEN